MVAIMAQCPFDVLPTKGGNLLPPYMAALSCAWKRRICTCSCGLRVPQLGLVWTSAPISQYILYIIYYMYIIYIYILKYRRTIKKKTSHLMKYELVYGFP